MPTQTTPPRYTVTREQLPGGWLYQVLDTATGERSIPAALSACERRAAQLNAQVSK